MPTIPQVKGSEGSGPWLEGWDYRKNHTICNATGAGTNYQIKLNVYYGTGTDSGDAVYLNGSCRSDFGDIRFTDTNATLLDYWMESKNDSNSAVFWVEVADDLSTSNATIYIYYGNSETSTTSDGEATFQFFDGFSGSSLNTTKWNSYSTGSDSKTVSGGMLTIDETGGGTGDTSHIYTTTFEAGTNIAMQVKCLEDEYHDSSYGQTSPIIGESLNFPMFASSTYNQIMIISEGDSRNVRHQSKNAGTWGTEDVIYATTPTLDTWHIYEYKKFSSNCVWTIYNTAYSSLGSINNSDAPQGFTNYKTALGARGSKTSWDYVFVRKCVSTEPSHGAWGSEESLGSSASWLEGWGYRKNHTICNATGAGTNYQVMINVEYGAGTDSGNTVYLNGSCRSDFGDIRFTNVNATILDYWMESKNDSNSAVFWVEVADDLSNSNATIYIYYGNLGATYTDDFTDQEHGQNTFLFFDTFDSWNSSLWGTKPSHADVNDGVLEINSTSGSKYVSSVDVFQYGKLRFRSKESNTEYYNTFDTGFSHSPDLDPTLCKYEYLQSNYGFVTRDGTATYTTTNVTRNTDYNVFQIDWVDANTAKLFIDDVLTATHTTHVMSSNESVFTRAYKGDSSIAINYVDWIFIAKVLDSEPLHGTWGSKESQSSGETESWLGWTYRKSHIICSSTGAGTHYQVKFNVDYNSGTDSGNTVYVNGCCRSDFGDILFTGADGETLLDYWMESKNDSNSAVFWVEIADDLSTSNATIYLYYGNSNATTRSNGTETFIFFDDFEDNLDSWASTGTTTVSSDHVYEGSNGFEAGTDQSFIKRNSTTTENVSVHTFYWDQQSEGHETQGLMACSTTEAAGVLVHENASTTNYAYRLGSTYYVSNVSRSTGWHEFCIRVSNGTKEYVIDDSVQNVTGTQTSINYIHLGSWWTADSAGSYFDACFVRKYIASGPTHGTWGTEESA